MISKKIILTGLAAAIVGTATLGTSQIVHAQTTGNNPMSQLTQMIAQKFNLNQSQVQAVVDQFQKQRKTQIQQKIQQRENTRLDQLVSQGKITGQQKQAILDEQAKLKSEYNPQSFKGITAAQRRQQIQKEQAEIQAWAKTQGISASYLRTGFMGSFHHGSWMKRLPSTTPTPTPNA